MFWSHSKTGWIDHMYNRVNWHHDCCSGCKWHHRKDGSRHSVNVSPSASLVNSFVLLWHCTVTVALHSKGERWDIKWRSALRAGTRECCGFRLMTRQSVTNPHLHRLEIHPSSQTSCRSCSWALSGCICQRDGRGGKEGGFRNRFHPEHSDLAPLTPGYTQRRPSPPGRNSLHNRTVHLADLQHFRRISLEKITRQQIVRVAKL